MSGKKCARLSAVALGIAIGFLDGVCMLVTVLAVIYGGFATDAVTHWATIFPGIEVSVKGAIIAGAWGFLTGFVVGLIIAWVYNLCLCCCTRGHCSCCKANCESCNPDVRK